MSGRKIFDGLSERLAGKLRSGEVIFPCNASLVRCLCVRSVVCAGLVARDGRAWPPLAAFSGVPLSCDAPLL